jgi:5-methylcytosine-specific restriction endonuclease McrA
MAHRMTAREEHAARGGRPWMRISRQIRRERPLCQRCREQGRITAAELVHHCIPVDRDKVRLLHVNPRDLMSLCRVCHETLHGRAPRQPIGLDGWPIGS